jgi:hypothetical protein
LAYLAHWHTGSIRRGADVGNRCEHGVLPKVVSLPPDNLVEQVSLYSGPSASER